MMKQVKLLTLLAIVGASSIQADMIDNTLDLVKKNWMHCGITLGLGNFAYDYCKRDWDADGKKLVVDQSDKVEGADEAYSVAMGAGVTLLEDCLKDGKTLDLKEGLMSSAKNAAAVWIVTKLSKQAMYRNLNRNHALFRGWWPLNAKFDDSAKKLFAFGIARSIVSRATKAIIPAAS